MRHPTRVASDRSDSIERGRVDHTGYEFELCADDHHWHQRWVQREQAMSHHTLGWKSMVAVNLEPGHSGSTYTWHCQYDVAYQALLFFSEQHWETGSGLGTRQGKTLATWPHHAFSLDIYFLSMTITAVCVVYRNYVCDTFYKPKSCLILSSYFQVYPRVPPTPWT